MAKANFLENEEIEVKVYTKRDALLEHLMEKFLYARESMQPHQEKWKVYNETYKGTRSETKEDWQANYTTSTLKELVRVKVPLYLNILFSKGIDSFDIKPGDIDDEEKTPIIKDILRYQLRNIGKDSGGFFGEWGNYAKQFEIYGYTVAMCFWRKEKNLRGDITFDSADMKTIDVFHFFPDPNSFGLQSWKFIQYRDKSVGYLRRQEELGNYENVIELRETTQPPEYDNPVFIPTEELPFPEERLDPRVELLEYHGEVPKSLIEGSLEDPSTIDPYEDKYVDAIITIGNRAVILRAEEYPYDCGNIFIESCKDRMLTEKFGIGTGEDIE
ncbi:MAG: hypothetical protein ACTSQA_07395, partial [Candidatus Heimdallarchaeaceae archaeon]